MTLKEARKLKPGDIVIERGTHARFRFVDIKEVTTYGIVGGGLCQAGKKKQLHCEKIPGEYYPDCRKQDVPYYFSPGRVSLDGPPPCYCPRTEQNMEVSNG